MNRRLHSVPIYQHDIDEGTKLGASFPPTKRYLATAGLIAQFALSSEFDVQVPGLNGLARKHCTSLSINYKYGPTDFLCTDVKDTILYNISPEQAIERYHIQVPLDIEEEFYVQTLTILTPNGRQTWFVGWIRGDSVKKEGFFASEYNHWRVPISSSNFPDELFKEFAKRYPNV